MPVQLLPFQKLVDMPNLAQRHRRTICGLAIASIVLIFTILCILVPAFIAGFAMSVYSTNTLFGFVGIPLMVIILILVCTSSFISFRNTDRWASTDTCCNLMRSNPACCTKCCAGNKHCCARMSSLHIAASVLTSSFCVLLVVLLFAGCNESDSITRAYESKYPSRSHGRSLRSLSFSHCLERSEKNVKIGSRVTLITDRQAFQNSFDNVPYIWDDAMTSLLGQTVTVVDRPKMLFGRPQSGIFGLPKSDPSSNQPVWFYPFSVIACVEDNGATITTTNQPTATKAPPETTVVAARFAPKSNAELKAAIAQCLKLSSDCSKGPRGPIVSWDVSGVTDMRYLFVDKHYNAVPGADKFNGDLSKWDVSRVTRMAGMFYKAKSFNGDLSKWDVSNVGDMEAMFQDAASFNGDISKWDVSKVFDIKSMFHGAKSFSQKLCGSWANLSAGLKRNMFDKSDLSLFCKTMSKTTNAVDKCLDVLFAIENYRSCCTNFGYMKKGRESVCDMASPCAKGGMQHHLCRFAARTTASAPTTTNQPTATTNAVDKCLDVFFAIENYRSCCTNFGYTKKGRESVCRMASPCAKGGMQDPRCQFATRTTASAPATTKYRARLDRTTPPRDKIPDKYRDYHYYGSGYRYRSTHEPPRDYSSYWEQHKYESSKHACSVLAGFEVPAIALMICLAITTAVSAHLLRKIEQAQPEIELLPAGKMVVVVQTCEDAVPALIKANIIDDTAQVTNDVNSTPGLKTEQNEHGSLQEDHGTSRESSSRHQNQQKRRRRSRADKRVHPTPDLETVALETVV